MANFILYLVHVKVERKKINRLLDAERISFTKIVKRDYS